MGLLISNPVYVLSQLDDQCCNHDGFGKTYSIVVLKLLFRPKQASELGVVLPSLAPPPKSPVNNAIQDTSLRFNPFDKSQEVPNQTTDDFFEKGQYSASISFLLDCEQTHLLIDKIVC